MHHFAKEWFLPSSQVSISDDELFAPEYRGIGIRIEDDVVVTANGCRNISENIPRHPDEIEKWMKGLLGR